MHSANVSVTITLLKRVSILRPILPSLPLPCLASQRKWNAKHPQRTARGHADAKAKGVKLDVSRHSYPPRASDKAQPMPPLPAMFAELCSGAFSSYNRGSVFKLIAGAPSTPTTFNPEQQRTLRVKCGLFASAVEGFLNKISGIRPVES